MSVHSTVRNDVDHPSFNGFEDVEEEGLSTKQRNTDYYLCLIEPYFDRFEVYSGAGELRRPYLYQWHALSKVFAGYDDAYVGIGSTPLEALRNLYKSIKEGEGEDKR